MRKKIIQFQMYPYGGENWLLTLCEDGTMWEAIVNKDSMESEGGLANYQIAFKEKKKDVEVLIQRQAIKNYDEIYVKQQEEIEKLKDELATLRDRAIHCHIESTIDGLTPKAYADVVAMLPNIMRKMERHECLIQDMIKELEANIQIMNEMRKVPDLNTAICQSEKMAKRARGEILG